MLAIGGSLQAAGKPIDGEHLQVSCLPGTRESAPQVLRPFRRGENLEEFFDVSYGSLLFGESSPQTVAELGARDERDHRVDDVAQGICAVHVRLLPWESYRGNPTAGEFQIGRASCRGRV